MIKWKTQKNDKMENRKKMKKWKTEKMGWGN